MPRPPERFPETLKCEEVYWHLYDDPVDARLKLAALLLAGHCYDDHPLHDVCLGHGVSV